MTDVSASSAPAPPVMRNTVAYMVAGLVPNFINLLVLPLYTRYLDPEDYGNVALVTSFTAFLGTVLGLQLANSIARLYFDYEGEDRKRYLSTILLGSVGTSLLILTPLHVWGPRVAEVLFPKADIPYHPLLALGFVLIFFQNLVNFGNAVLRVQQRGVTVMAASLGHTMVTVGLGVYLVVIREAGAAGLLGAMAAGMAFHAGMQAVALRATYVGGFRWSMLRRAVAYSLPIIPHSFGGLLYMYSDKYVAGLYVPIAAVGLYDFGNKIAMVFKMAVMSFHHAITPVFMRESKMERERTRRRFGPLITRWAGGYAFMAAGISLLSREVIELLFPRSFHGSSVFIPILTGAYMLFGLFMFVMDALLYEKKTAWVPWISISAGVVNVVANVVLIPRFGILAAAWTTLLAFAICFGLAWGLSRKVYPLIFEWGALLRIYGLLVGVVVVGNWVPIEDVSWRVVLKGGMLLGYGAVLWICNEGGLRDWILEQGRKLRLKRKKG